MGRKKSNIKGSRAEPREKSLVVDQAQTSASSRDVTSVISEDDEVFADASNQSLRWLADKSTSHERLAEVYSTSAGHSQLDQFASALVRLQADLNKTGSRLRAMESKIEQMMLEQKRSIVDANQSSEASWIATATSKAGMIYLSWPVIVYLAMRLLEKRRSPTS